MAATTYTAFRIHIRFDKKPEEKKKILGRWEAFLDTVAPDLAWRIVPEGLVTVKGVKCFRYRVEMPKIKIFNILGSKGMPAMRA